MMGGQAPHLSLRLGWKGSRFVGENRFVDHALPLKRVARGPLVVQPGQRVWARQLNNEFNGTKIANRGGQLWILGLKTEGHGTVIDSLPGASSELLGTLLYPATSLLPDEVAFKAVDARVSLTDAACDRQHERADNFRGASHVNNSRSSTTLCWPVPSVFGQVGDLFVDGVHLGSQQRSNRRIARCPTITERFAVFIAQRLFALPYGRQNVAIEIRQPVPQDDDDLVHGALQRRVVRARIAQTNQLGCLLGCVAFVHIGEPAYHRLNIGLGPRKHLAVTLQNVVRSRVNVMQCVNRLSAHGHLLSPKQIVDECRQANCGQLPDCL